MLDQVAPAVPAAFEHVTASIAKADANCNHHRSSDGTTLIQTDDHTFDPNRQVSTVISQNWAELTPK